MVFVVLAGLIGLILGVLRATHGHFTYSLDDPYIHLALADNIRSGNYGINPGSPSSPSSSILWPFLLAPTAGLWFQDWVPLALNVAFTMLSSVLVVYSVGLVVGRRWLVALISISAMLLFNFVGVAFTGMEHSMQVTAALAVGLGTTLVVRGENPPKWFLIAVVLGPLVRYENASLSFASAVVLALSGYRRLAALLTGAWVATLAAFSAFLLARGLSPLPSSVLAKSGYGRSVGHMLATLVNHLHRALDHPIFLVAILVLVVDVVLRRTFTRLHLFLALILGAHAVAGQFDGWGRYELYVLAGCFPPMVIMVSGWRGIARGTRWLPYLAAALAVWASLPLADVTLRTPDASQQIWSQQGQTAVFVRDYWRRPIAVNDLGLVSYRGGQRVLDLWGLASQEARVDRLGHKHGWVRSVTSEHHVRLAAIFTAWFRHLIPHRWVRVATLAVPKRVAVNPRVDFYATSPAFVQNACSALRSFQQADDNPETRISLRPACQTRFRLGGSGRAVRNKSES